MVNFDNAATTYPKPLVVRQAVSEAVARYGNAGRGGHQLAQRTAEMVYRSRETVADFLGAKVENTIFTMNCTHGLNLAIQGIVQPGDHVIFSDLEHNAVYRPVMALSKSGKLSYTMVKTHPEDRVTLERMEAAIRPNTKAIFCTIASNVTGQILPYGEIGALCKKHGICFVADGAQGVGLLPVSLEQDHINILCTAGHKGLYGITGTGVLVTDCTFPIQPLMQGGTGSNSRSPWQPEFLPDRLECGTLNVIGAASLQAGIHFVRQQGVQTLFRRESALCALFCRLVAEIPEITVYREPGVSYVPIVSFTVGSVPAETVAAYLASKGFCLRAGLHCAPLAHEKLGTENGTIRFAPSAFSRESGVYGLVDALRQYCATI